MNTPLGHVGPLAPLSQASFAQVLIDPSPISSSSSHSKGSTALVVVDPIKQKMSTLLENFLSHFMASGPNDSLTCNAKKVLDAFLDDVNDTFRFERCRIPMERLNTVSEKDGIYRREEQDENVPGPKLMMMRNFWFSSEQLLLNSLSKAVYAHGRTSLYALNAKNYIFEFYDQIDRETLYSYYSREEYFGFLKGDVDVYLRSDGKKVMERTKWITFQNDLSQIITRMINRFGETSDQAQNAKMASTRFHNEYECECIYSYQARQRVATVYDSSVSTLSSPTNLPLLCY